MSGPQPNVLDKYGSYTYRASVYVLSPDDYTSFVKSSKKSTQGYKLLFQSGGAGPGDTRASSFPVDFYIDSITMKNLVQGKGSGVSHTVAELKFTVLEPMGLTLIDRLYAAVKESGNGNNNYTAAQYLMAIRFNGYDENGQLVQGIGGGATIEKFIPFEIKGINWTVSSKLATYEFDCVPVAQLIGAGFKRGTIPYDMQLMGKTVESVLAGPKGGGKGNSAPEPGKKPPLAEALTEFSKSLKEGKNPIYDEYDEYEIEFAPGADAIKEATVVLSGDKKEANQTPFTKAKDPKGGSTAYGKDVTKKNISVVAGQPIIQVIETVIRNSSYITDQALLKVDAITGEEKPNGGGGKKPLKWFRITWMTEPKQNFDKKRRDFAYKIKYVISAYTVDKYESKYFPVGQFRGVHKSYEYWFTGKNTAVLDYSETLNSSYTLLVSGDAKSADAERSKVAATLREMYTYTYGPRSGESSQGTREKGNEPGANLADSLSSYGDLAKTRLRIIGDPAWIQQGSMCDDPSNCDFESKFLPDGTINFDAEQILFEVTWRKPADYDLGTGLADPNSQGEPISRVYMASAVISEFKQGKFEQTIEGLLFLIPKDDGSNKAPDAPPQNSSSQERAPEKSATTTTADQARVAQTAPPGETNIVGGRLVTNTAGGAALVHPRAGIGIGDQARGAVPAPTAPLPGTALSPAGVPATQTNNNPQPVQGSARPITSNGENISVVDRFLGTISRQNNIPPQKIAQD